MHDEDGDAGWADPTQLSNRTTAFNAFYSGTQDGDVVYIIILAPSISDDSNYNSIDPDDIAITNDDDDAAGITISAITTNTTTEIGGIATFTIVLDSRPTAVVKFEISSDDTILEIGSGRGTLTELIAKTGARLYSFEIDRDLIENLEKKFSVIG